MTPERGTDHNGLVTARSNPETGEIDASAVFDTSAERLFRALTTEEICDWWVRPGVFDTREWSGDLREGGRWAAAGVGGGQAYRLEGEFVVIDKPRTLTQTWMAVGAPGDAALLAYDLTPDANGVRLTLRHTGLMNPEICEKTRAGWETSLTRLQEIIAAENG
ncbi:MAG: SRPBCC domain-containing protein [Minwuiales bacterium]|nr:SRPBCC domain-containing protein [Minwuiales bacterium]